MTDQLLRIKAWDSDLEEETTGGEKEKNGREDTVDKPGHVQKVQKLIYAAKVFHRVTTFHLVNLRDFGRLKTKEDKISF